MALEISLKKSDLGAICMEYIEQCPENFKHCHFAYS